MSLKEQLFQDLKIAMREKDKIKKDTVQLVRSGILQIEKDQKIELDDEGVIQVVVKQLKSRRDALPDFEKSGRTDLVEGLNKEIEILLRYLPEQLSESDIQEIVGKAIEEVGANTMKDMGRVMAIVNPRVNGRADGKIVSGFVKEILQKNK